MPDINPNWLNIVQDGVAFGIVVEASESSSIRKRLFKISFARISMQKRNLRRRQRTPGQLKIKVNRGFYGEGRCKPFHLVGQQRFDDTRQAEHIGSEVAVERTEHSDAHDHADLVGIAGMKYGGDWEIHDITRNGFGKDRWRHISYDVVQAVNIETVSSIVDHYPSAPVVPERWTACDKTPRIEQKVKHNIEKYLT